MIARASGGVIIEMSLGYSRDQNVFNLNDTAELLAYLYDKDDESLTEDDLLGVTFNIQAPDNTMATVVGEITEDGVGRCLYDDTDQVGQYTVVATFLTDEGNRSTRSDFEVIDPFNPDEPSANWLIAVEAWSKFEDCFDAEDEGPWLRDMTLNYFNKDKMSKFIDDALMDINLQNPPTSLSADAFIVTTDPPTASADLPLLSQAICVQIIRHLCRSYTEQPNPVGAQIAWHDRRDYLQRWQSVLQIEQQQYLRMLALFKRRFLGLGQTRLLVSSKAGRLIPAPLRTRMAGRGYW